MYLDIEILEIEYEKSWSSRGEGEEERMLDPIVSVDARTGLADDRIEALRRSSLPGRRRPLRHGLGRTLVRIGTRLGGAYDSPRPRHALPPMPDEAPAPAGASSL